MNHISLKNGGVLVLHSVIHCAVHIMVNTGLHLLVSCTGGDQQMVSKCQIIKCPTSGGQVRDQEAACENQLLLSSNSNGKDQHLLACILPTAALNTDPNSCPPEVKPHPMKTICRWRLYVLSKTERVRHISFYLENIVLPAPVLMATVTKKGSIQFSWNRVPGAMVCVTISSVVQL